MKKRLLEAICTICCLCWFFSCKPSEPQGSNVGAETAVAEEKIKKFKADPSKSNKDEVDKAMADLNAKIKELDARQAKEQGAEKERTSEKLSALRMQYHLYTVDVAAVKVMSATGQALEKAGEAVKDAANSVNQSLKSDKKD